MLAYRNAAATTSLDGMLTEKGRARSHDMMVSCCRQRASERVAEMLSLRRVAAADMAGYGSTQRHEPSRHDSPRGRAPVMHTGAPPCRRRRTAASGRWSPERVRRRMTVAWPHRMNKVFRM